MAAHVLLVDVDTARCRRPAQAAPGEGGLRGRSADILFGDFDRTRTEAAIAILKKNLPVNAIYRVRSGCEALAFLRQREAVCEPEKLPRPILALLDEDLSGMAGHSILNSLFRTSTLGELIVIVLTGRGRIPVHRNWTPDADGYLEKPFTFRKLEDSLRSLGTFRSHAGVDIRELPAWQGA